MRHAKLAVFTLFCFPLIAQDSVATLKQGAAALNDGKPQAAIAPLKAAQSRLPRIADYTAFFLAQAYAQTKDHAAAAAAVAPVFAMKPDSPVAGYASVLGAKSLLELNDYRGAVAMLERVPDDRRPQPSASLLLAKADEGAGNLLAAARAWQRVFYEYPLSDEAGEAAQALDRLRTSLGRDYPAPSAAVLLGRADRLLRGRQYAKARAEFQSLSGELAGADRELALVRIGAADYEARKTSSAVRYLESLRVTSPEAEAERLWWLAATHRRDENDSSMEAALAQLASVAPQSPRRLDALVLAGNRYLVQNRSAEYLPHYRACATGFTAESDAAYCHWKVVWRAWMDRSSGTEALMREHLQRFPSSEKAGAAIYYLGRLAAQDKDFSNARRYYQELDQRYPNYYYAVLAREELKRPEIASAKPGAAADKFLASLRFPSRERAPDFTVDPVSAARIERAKLLESAGLERWAETEMRFGARNGGNPWALAIEMAETAARRGDHAQAVRYIKGTVPGYLFLPRDAAPQRFWRLAFPFPYRGEIFQYARTYNLDPYLVASLIRQESEFDPAVVSYAGAIGLMQVMPPTGREIARRLRLGHSTPARLKQPVFNLRLGTYYMRRLLDARNGSVEETLAGYNAGGSRVRLWENWGPYQEPNEFVETIPFTQTRDYVQIILRNRDIYRWLYANEPVSHAAAESHPATVPHAAGHVPAVKTPAPKKAAVTKPAAKRPSVKSPSSKKAAPKKSPKKSRSAAKKRD